MPLLDYQQFAPLLHQFSGQRIGFFEAAQDIGSKSVYHATKQLCYRFGVKHITLGHHRLDQPSAFEKIDYIATSGLVYPAVAPEQHNALQRQLANCGKPLILFPQFIARPDQWLDNYDQVYQTHNKNEDSHPKSVFHTDLLLGLETRNYDAYPRINIGVFTQQQNSHPVGQFSLGDPHNLAISPFGYFELASLFQCIITDRADFAMLALCANRRTVLLNEHTGRNAELFRVLEQHGCEWIDAVLLNQDELQLGAVEARDQLWKRLIRTQSGATQLHTVFHPNKTTSINNNEVNFGDNQLTFNDSALSIAEKLHHGCSPQEITEQMANEYATDKLTIGQSVHDIATILVQHQAIKSNKKAPTIDVVINETRQDQGKIIVSAEVAKDKSPPRELWFALPATEAKYVNQDNADPFVLALLWQAMYTGHDLCIHGAAVSAVLMEHLNEYQKIWAAWMPAVAKQINIIADQTKSTGNKYKNAKLNTLLAFSGGVDSNFSLLKTLQECEGDGQIMAITAHGFDIPVGEQAAFKKVQRQIINAIPKQNVQHVCVQTNLRSFSPKWDLSHGAAVAALLNLLGRFANKGVIASTFPADVSARWGSNHQTDPLLGSNYLQIQHQGADTSRFNKIRALIEKPEQIKNLHVCWSYQDYARNCGRCQKCVLLQLSLRTLDAPLDCFEQALDSQKLIDHIPNSFPGALDLNDMQDINAYCKQNKIDTDWSQALSAALEKIQTAKEWRVL